MSTEIQRLDLSSFSSTEPAVPVNVLFIHHSCGAAFLADPGEKAGKYCLYDTHPNGGGGRKLLRENNYLLHEATYESVVGQDTDINHWRQKFQEQMDLVLQTKLQDEVLEEGIVNKVIVFKSCFPANLMTADGSEPGDPDSPEKTLWNAKAAYNSLLPIFSKHPNTLFVAFTAPPAVKPWMGKVQTFLNSFVGKDPKSIGRRARSFNSWLVDSNAGWLSSYQHNNVVVFDYYDILTGNGKSNWAEYASRGGKNSHPTSEGHLIVAPQFISFLNQAVRYAGIVENE